MRSESAIKRFRARPGAPGEKRVRGGRALSGLRSTSRLLEYAGSPFSSFEALDVSAKGSSATPGARVERREAFRSDQSAGR